MEKSHNNSLRYELFDNRRKYPRLKMKLPVTVTTPKQRIIKAFIHNLSPDGIQIIFNNDTGVGGLQEELSAVYTPESCKCTLRFDLAHVDVITHVNINAHPVYLKPVGEDGSACGMFFSEENLSENKKISDFLFYQLQVSFTELENTKKIDDKDAGEKAVSAHRTVVENTQQSVNSEVIRNISEEVDELILQMNYPGTQLEPVRQLLFRVLNSLRIIQELTRHNNEIIKSLEHKLSRRG